MLESVKSFLGDTLGSRRIPDEWCEAARIGNVRVPFSNPCMGAFVLRAMLESGMNLPDIEDTRYTTWRFTREQFKLYFAKTMHAFHAKHGVPVALKGRSKQHAAELRRRHGKSPKRIRQVDKQRLVEFAQSVPSSALNVADDITRGDFYKRLPRTVATETALWVFTKSLTWMLLHDADIVKRTREYKATLAENALAGKEQKAEDPLPNVLEARNRLLEDLKKKVSASMNDAPAFDTLESREREELCRIMIENFTDPKRFL